VIHELSHAAVALRCGDPTPRRDGRMTLDPRRTSIRSDASRCSSREWDGGVRSRLIRGTSDRQAASAGCRGGPLAHLVVAAIFAVALRGSSGIRYRRVRVRHPRAVHAAGRDPRRAAAGFLSTSRCSSSTRSPCRDSTVRGAAGAPLRCGPRSFSPSSSTAIDLRTRRSRDTPAAAVDARCRRLASAMSDGPATLAFEHLIEPACIGLHRPAERVSPVS